MASMLSMQIQCPVCLNALRDPVCLPCEHSYCRACLTRHLAVSADESTCPECRTPFSRADIRVNRTLRNIVDAAKVHLEEHNTLRDRAMTILTGQTQNTMDKCLDHIETLRLYCETDQKPICVVCRDDRRHQGHRVKTLSDALQAKKEKAAEKLETLFTENEKLVELIGDQVDEILKTRERLKVLTDQITEQFAQMCQFLKDKEVEIKALLEEEEDKLLRVMEVNLFRMEEMLTEVRVNQGLLMSALETDQPCQFLQWWTESGQSLVGETAAAGGIRSPAEDVSVTCDSLFLGPYETHLQFFVWKEMLTSIQTVPHHHAMETKGDQNVKVTPSGLNVQCKKGSLKKNKHGLPWLKTESSFKTGQYYWEVEVGQKLDWEIGVCGCESDKASKDTMLCFNSDSGYHIQQSGRLDKRPMRILTRPRKIGVYLDCERKQVSFYNADSMTLIETAMLSRSFPFSLCVSPGQYLNKKNSDPLTVCWY
ncbi:hypothetical protein SRHO_G00062430 [Serrasalmus rhombeus]